MNRPAVAEAVWHATTVAHTGRGCLILGPSGAGKSALALQLLALGADLVADDRTELWVQGDAVMAACPPALQGLIEARGVGLLRAQAVGPVQVHLVVDLAQVEPDRLPPLRHFTVLDRVIPLVLGGAGGHFPAAVLRYLTDGRAA